MQLLIDNIDDQRNDIYIMVDKKTDINIFNNISAQKSKIYFCKNRTKVFWGNTSQIVNEINIFKEARQGGTYTYFHLLSGVDMPIKSQDYIHRFFSEQDGLLFIDISKSDIAEYVLERKIKYYRLFPRYYRTTNRVIAKATSILRNAFISIQKAVKYSRHLPWQTIKYGSQWVSITPDFVDYIISNEQKILAAYKGTYCPDEVYKQTLALNSKFNKRLSVKGNMRLIDWSRGKPYIWKASDLDEIMSSECLFVRKVDPDSAKAITSATH